MNAQELLDRLSTENNKNIEALEILASAKLPTVLYGAGNYATSVRNFLAKKGLNNIDAVCLDREFVTERRWHGLPVYSTDEVANRFGRFNLLIGMADFVRAEKSFENGSAVENMLFLDSTITTFDLLTRKFIELNIDDFLKTYRLLEDNRSRDTFIAFLNARITGIPRDLYHLQSSDQYFPEEILMFSSDEGFVDAGAYDGDTVRKFIQKTEGNYREIHAFEPDPANFARLSETTRDLRDVHIENKGLWSSRTTLTFDTDDLETTRPSVQPDGGTSIEVDSLDTYLGGRSVSFIKVDIEGAELQALHGAEDTIRTQKPKLAISAYHKPDDLIELPAYLSRVVPEYRLHLRHHMPISQELVLYATAAGARR